MLILIKFCWADYVPNCLNIPFCFFDGHISADDRKKSSYLCQDVVLAHFGCPRVSFSCCRWLLSPFEVICKMDQARSEVSQPRPNLPLHRLATPSTTRNANPPRNHPPPQFKTRPPKSSAQKSSCTQRYRRKIVALARKKRASIAPSHQSWSYSPFSAYRVEEGMLLMQYSRVCKLIQ